MSSFVNKEEPYLANETYTFEEALEVYSSLAETAPKYCNLSHFGSSDYGIPVPLFVINKTGVFTTEEYQSKTILLINNAIHPGEPCGVDASIKLASKLIEQPNLIPSNVIIAIIPIYNIGGAHNRNCCSRANQNGPKEYGFRGNAKNLDLNRDFVKMDSKNTRAFQQIFHLLKPAIFVDTHTSNGADYQHTMTLITSQLDKMNPALSEYTKTRLNPALFEEMENDGYPMVPYVHTINQIPDNGIQDYLETPRYSTGYTNLFNTISYVTEAHMLKPYKERVMSTLIFLKKMIILMEKDHIELQEIRKKALKELNDAKQLPIDWKLDTTKFEKINFLGYTAEYKPSAVTGHQRLFYNRDKPFSKDIRYYNSYKVTQNVRIPEYYIIPKAWDIIVDRLKASDIEVFTLKQNTTLAVDYYEITNYETRKSPYEGHYLHYNTEVARRNDMVTYQAGDYVVPVRNENIRFIVETLEPHAPDSYFSWNYFDAILQQKEWFSSYVFEDEAAKILEEQPTTRTSFEQKQATDTAFANNPFEQLYYIYKLSDHYEKSHNRYPITRYSKSIEPNTLLLSK